MSLERIEDWYEAVDGVTTLAFNATHRVRELAQMGVLMAVDAFAETQDAYRTPGSMTLVALHPPMFSYQRESRPVVIETTAVDLLPGCRGVAGAAAASQPTDMGISMAVGAAAVREPCETELTHRDIRTWRGTRSVALDTGHLNVSTGEDELGPVVIKSIYRLPTLQRVTRLAALGRKLLLVCVLVAGQTVLFLQSQKSPGQIFSLIGKIWSLPHQGALVAISTLQTGVRPFERIAGSPVIERCLSLLTPPHQLEVFPMVLYMASLTSLVITTRVQADVSCDAKPEDSMALETTVGCHTLACLVASQALATAFQIGVGAAQLAR